MKVGRWLPAGVVSTDALKEVVGRAVPGRWVEHPNFWAVACDYESGRRIPFGRAGAPRAHITDAVAASCAIPGFYRPVKIGRRRYVDGGVCSAASLDLVAGRGLDLVVCLNPLSGAPGSPADPRDWFGALTRRANGRRLAHETRKVRRFGTEVALIEPTPDDLEAMGRNLMSVARRQRVIETAERTVLQQLRRPELWALLAGLPAGEPHKIRRPAGPPSSWPRLGPAASPRRERAA